MGLLVEIIRSSSRYFSFAYEYNWFWQSIWARRIDPLYLLGSMFFVWKKLYAYAPTLGKLVLLNPFTYVSEGVRATLIGGNQFIPALICIVGLCIAICVTVYLLKVNMKKTLDYI